MTETITPAAVLAGDDLEMARRIARHYVGELAVMIADLGDELYRFIEVRTFGRLSELIDALVAQGEEHAS